MKSIESIASGVIANIGEQQLTVSNRLPSRPLPLDAQNIDQIDQAIGRHFSIKRDPVYGYVPRLDTDGETIGQEYDVVAMREKYEPIEGPELPQKLVDAILRPAERQHVIFHLTRLAAHRRDTRGKEALQAVLEDLSRDLVGISEWSIVLACRELRGKRETWYPTTGEILALIRQHDEAVRAVFSGGTPPSTKPKSISQERKADPHDRHDKPRSQWNEADWQGYIADAEKMLATAEAHPSALSVDAWQAEVEKRTREHGEAQARVLAAG